MKFQAPKKDLIHALERAAAVANPRATMPILVNALLVTNGDKLMVSALDLTMSVSSTVQLAAAPDSVSVCVPAKAFLDRVRALDGDAVIVTVDGDTVSVRSTSAPRKYNVRSVPGDEFPALPGPSNTSPVHEVDSSTLSMLFDSTKEVISEEDDRVALNAMQLAFGATSITVATTDGHRLAEAVVTVDATSDIGTVLIQLKSLQQVTKFCKGGSRKLRVSVNGSNLIFEDGSAVVTVKLADAQFPPIHEVIPKKQTFDISVDRAAFLAAIKAALLSANDDSAVTISVTNGEIQIESGDAELGECIDTLACVQGKNRFVKFGICGKYLIDTLNAFVCERVKLDIAGELEPLTIIDEKPSEAFKLLHVIMPMRI